MLPSCVAWPQLTSWRSVDAPFTKWQRCPVDRLRALAVFCKVVELQGLSEAARVLGVSKAAVSKYVTSLEGELDARLIHRTSRTVGPTTTGRVVYERARALLDQMRELEAAAKADKEEPVGTLRVSAPVAFGLLQLGEPLAQFARAHPAVRLELSLSDRFVRLAEEGFDVGVRVTAHLEQEDIVAVPLGSSVMIACAAPEYLARAGRPRAPRELEKHACIAFSPPGATGRVGWRFDSEHENAGVVWIEPAVRVDNSLLQLDLACSGLGVAFLLSFVAARELRAGALIPLFEGTATETRTVYAIYPSPRHASAKVRALVRALQAAYRNASWATAGDSAREP
jgi:DNA-binding transcriptional LysR family regulator